jgi:hypothetical protein
LLEVADVVKLHTWLIASGLPARSVAPVVTVAEYVVLAARALVGVNLAMSVAAL